MSHTKLNVCGSLVFSNPVVYNLLTPPFEIPWIHPWYKLGWFSIKQFAVYNTTYVGVDLLKCTYV